jgi:hypothetical protein
VERDLAGRLARHADDDERADPIADPELRVDRRALCPRVRGVGGVDRDRRTRPLAHERGPSRVVPIRQDDPRNAFAHEEGEDVVPRLDGIDADVSARVPHEPAVEVVAVRRREPRPADDAGDDLTHADSLAQRAPG